MADDVSGTLPELYQLRRSHFNEKARWGFDHKGVAHRRISMLPGLQRRPMKKMTGQSLVPVARFADDFVAGSGAILEALEHRYPDRPLFPTDPEQSKRALEIQHRFDEEVGPLTRRAVFSWLTTRPLYFAQVFADGVSTPQRIMYSAFMTLATGFVRRETGLTDEASVEAGFAGARAGLDLVAANAGPDGYLVGDRFTVADLAAAALLSLTIDTGHPDMVLPRPYPPEYERWLEHFADHPGTIWVRAMYDRHRPPSHAVTS
jgi:glutathione S-transferase